VGELEEFVQKHGWKIGLVAGIPLGVFAFKFYQKLPEKIGKMFSAYQNSESESYCKKIEDLAERLEALGKRFDKYER